MIYKGLLGSLLYKSLSALIWSLVPVFPFILCDWVEPWMILV